MQKYHISSSGKPAICTAKKGNCPLGGESEHFNSLKEAKDSYEKKSFEKFDTISSVTKNETQVTDTDIEELKNIKTSFKTMQQKEKEKIESGSLSPEEIVNSFEKIYKEKLNLDEKTHEIMSKVEANIDSQMNSINYSPGEFDNGAKKLKNLALSGNEINNIVKGIRNKQSAYVSVIKKSHWPTQLSLKQEDIKLKALPVAMEKIGGNWDRTPNGVVSKIDSRYKIPIDAVSLDENGDINNVMYSRIYIGRKPSDTSRELSKLEALHSAYMAGASKATVVFNVNGQTDVKTYDINAPIDESGRTIKDISEETNKLFNTYYKIGGGNNVKRTYQTPFNKASNDEHSNNIAAWTGKSKEDSEKISTILLESDISDDEKKIIIADLFKQYDPVKEGRVMSVDFETTEGFHPLNGAQVVESGISLMNADGSLTEHRFLHGLDERDLKHNGTGAEDFHRVTPDMVKNKKRFKDSESLKIMQKHLDKGGIITAHHATFEKRFFASAGLKFNDSQIIDTKYISAYIDDKGDSEFNTDKLESFSQRNGVPYEEAHGALQDAAMARKALTNLIGSQWGKSNRNKLSDEGKFIYDKIMRI